MRRKRNYAKMKLNVPKRVTLPNGRTFVAHYKRISRAELPPIIVMRRKELHQEVIDKGNKVAEYLILLKKVAKNPLVCLLAKKGSEYALGIYHNLTKRVKNKTLNRVLNSDAAHLVLK